MEKGKKGKGHGHPWKIGVVGILIAAVLYYYLPEYKGTSNVVAIFALAHLLIGGVVLISAYIITPERLRYILFEKRLLKKNEGKLYFGWSMGWMNLFWVVGLVFLISSCYVYLLDSSLIWLSILLFLFSVNLFIGNIVLRNSKKNDFLTLPYVDLLKSENDIILDAGCGSGRTSIALGKVMKNSKIIALDRFDADYIENGGKDLLKRNLAIAGIQDKVEITQGDVTELNFKDNYFDSAISSYMFDHLGKHKLTALNEVSRVLKPDGKFLLIIFVPNWATFAVFNALSFTLTSRNQWKKLFKQVNLQVLDEGAINGGVYYLLQK
jgi:SAM-dependent methyltransferase